MLTRDCHIVITSGSPRVTRAGHWNWSPLRVLRLLTYRSFPCWGGLVFDVVVPNSTWRQTWRRVDADARQDVWDSGPPGCAAAVAAVVAESACPGRWLVWNRGPRSRHHCSDWFVPSRYSAWSYCLPSSPLCTSTNVTLRYSYKKTTTTRVN